MKIRTIIVIILLLACFGIYSKCSSDQRSLDEQELHYDADDWFILADKETGLVGIYDGIKPVHYFYCEELLDVDLNDIPYLAIPVTNED